MEYINGYKAEESLYTKDGKEISVLRLEVENEEKVLDEWATHFREQYRYMEDLDFERHGTRRTRQEHLRDYVFPSDSVRPGPSIRVGDFCEILVADYIEFVCNYYVPRIRYRDKFNRNTSPHGSDVLGFKMRKKASTTALFRLIHKFLSLTQLLPPMYHQNLQSLSLLHPYHDYQSQIP